MFTALIYYCVVLPISRFPMSVLYRFSDAFFFLAFSVMGYRKKVVYENLRRSFPSKSPEEIDGLARDFYHHFCDLIWESVKAFTLSDREIRERMVCVNPYLLDRYFEEGRSVILAGGHYNNWEWFGVAVSQQIRHKAVAIYKPLSNRFLDVKMRKTRGKFGLFMLPIREVPEFFRRMKAEKERPPSIIVFGSDQSPGDSRKAHWIQFLGQETAAIFGPEKYAKEYGLPVIYGVIRKRSRGYYEFEFREVTDRPTEHPHGWITERTNALLEEDICREPRYWLWTHRRWKHRKPEMIESSRP